MSSTLPENQRTESSPRTTLALLNQLERRYREIPVEAIIKQDLLRCGINFEKESLASSDFKNKDYFIFSFDHVTLSEQDETHRFRIPEEIRISGGEFGLSPTVVSVRFDPASPYLVKLQDGEPVLYLEGVNLGQCQFPPIPDYYRHKTSSGRNPGEIAPVIEWGYLIYLTIFRNCQYFGKDEECAFCDINHHYRQQKNSGRPYTGIKPIEDILETLAWIDREDSTAQVYTLTGGSITSGLRGKNEVEFYLEYARAIEEKFPGRWLGKVVTQAWERDELRRLKDAGIRIYHPNFEVWDRRLFEILCPGKERFIGRDEWLKRIINGAEVFGPEAVIPNFVGGVEMAAPHGFTDYREAVASTAEGLDFFMSRGIMPRFTTWCPEPHAALGPQAGAPLEYFCELLTTWKEIFEKHKLPAPDGYGPVGVGNAVFSVSAFMDVINYQGRN